MTDTLRQKTPIQEPITVTATPGGTLIPLPTPPTNGQRIVLTVHSSAAVVELVSEPGATQGLTIPIVSASDENFRAGTYNGHAELYAYADPAASITFVAVVLPSD